MPMHIIDNRAVRDGKTGSASVVKIRGDRQDDGTIIAPNGATWIVGKRS